MSQSNHQRQLLSEIYLPNFLKNLSPGFFCAFSLLLLIPFSIKTYPPPILYFLSVFRPRTEVLCLLHEDILNHLSFYPHMPGLIFFPPCRLGSSAPVYSKARLLLLHYTLDLYVIRDIKTLNHVHTFLPVNSEFQVTSTAFKT